MLDAWAVVAMATALLAWDAWRRWLARDAMLARVDLGRRIDGAQLAAERAMATAQAGDATLTALHTEVADLKRVVGNTAAAAVIGAQARGPGRMVRR